MAAKKSSYFSDDELKAELQKLGYNDVTPDVFNMMKNDLSVLVERDDISSRKLKNVSPVRYTSSLKQFRSAEKEILNSSENDSSLLHSSSSIKKDLYSKYKNRFNYYGLNIESRSQVDQQSSKIYQVTSDNYKTGCIVNNISEEQDSKITGDSKPTVKVFPKSHVKDTFSNVVSDCPEDNFVTNKPHLSKSSPIDKGCHQKDNAMKVGKEIKDKNKLHNLNPICESNYSASVSKSSRYKDNSLKIEREQSKRNDKNMSSSIENKSVNQGNCGNGLISKKSDLKTDNKMQKIALMTNKTKATVECRSLNVMSKSQSSSSHEQETSIESTINSSNHQNNSENEKPEGIKIPGSKSVSKNTNLSKSQKYDKNSEKKGSDIKKSLINRKTVVNNSIILSGSTCSAKSSEQQINKLTETSLKSNESFQNSSSVLSDFNHKVSPKLPSIEQSRASKMCGQSISASINISNGIENQDSKCSRFSLDSSLDAESHESKFLSSPSFDSSPETDNSLPKYRFSALNRHQPESPGQNHFSGLSSFDSSQEPEDPLEKYRRRFKLNAYSSQDDLLRAASSVKIKRKVLRHRNGESIVTEELLNVPSIFTSSYPSTELGLESSKSFSSDDLSFRTAVVPEVLRSSYSTPRSIHVRIANQRKKKADPVAMYNYYKKFWNNFKPPGEKSHDKLRWAVRDRMLDYKL